MLSFENVSLSFGGLKAINNLSFEISKDEVTALIGPNGAGKTSVLNVVNRFYKPQEGSVIFDGIDLLTKAPHEIVDLGIARSFQNVALFKELSVADNLKVGSDHRTNVGLLRNTFRTPNCRRHEREAQSDAHEILEFLEIPDLARKRAGDLAFGHQKLVDIGRALIAKPKLLLLDEPAAGMAEGQKIWLGEKIRQIPSRFGATVLLIDHDMRLVLGVSTRVLVVEFGIKIAEGTPTEIREDPRVIAAYLGEESGVMAQNGE